MFDAAFLGARHRVAADKYDLGREHVAGVFDDGRFDRAHVRHEAAFAQVRGDEAQ